MGPTSHLEDSCTYTTAVPSYSGRVTAPTSWNNKTRTIVNNESSELIRMFNEDFRNTSADAAKLRPPQAVGTIDAATIKAFLESIHGALCDSGP